MAESSAKARVEGLDRFNKVALGRELQMIELKEKLRALGKGKE